MSDQPISLRAFLRDARWNLPLWVGVILLMWLLDVGGMRDLSVAGALLLPVDFFIVLGPLTWLLWQRLMLVPHRANDPAIWKFLGGSALWAVVSGAAIAALLSVLGLY